MRISLKRYGVDQILISANSLSLLSLGRGRVLKRYSNVVHPQPNTNYAPLFFLRKNLKVDYLDNGLAEIKYVNPNIYLKLYSIEFFLQIVIWKVGSYLLLFSENKNK